MNTSLESFARVAKLYRWLRILSACGFVSFMLSVWAGTAFSIKCQWLLYLAGASWFTTIAAGFAASVCFRCTECESSLGRANGDYCPGCGSRALSRREWWNPRRCGDCGLDLRYRKGGRRFKVRYCSVCSAHLDERGL